MAYPPDTDPEDRDPEDRELERGSDTPALNPVLIIVLLVMLGLGVYAASYLL
jgi:hypothetical protein